MCNEAGDVVNPTSVLRAISAGDELEYANQTLSQLACANRCLRSRDTLAARAIIESLGQTQSDLESFLLTLVRLRMALDSVDLSRAEASVAELNDHPLMADPAAAALAGFRVGTFLRIRSELDTALTLQLQSSAYFRSVGWKFEEALCINEVGSIQLLRGDMTAAVSSYVSVIDVIREYGGDASYAPLLANLATALHRSGSVTEAEQRYREVLGMGSMKVPSTLRAQVLLNLAVIAKSTDGFDDAESLYREAIELLDPAVSPSLFARAIAGLADHESHRGRYEAARSLLADVARIPTESLQISTRLMLMYTSAYLNRLDGDHKEVAAEVFHAVDLGLASGLLEDVQGILSDVLTWAHETDFRLQILEYYRRVQDERLKSVSKGVNAVIDLRSLFEQERSRLEIDRQQELSRVIVDTQTRTMSEIGRELHDSIGQDLTVLLRLTDRLADDRGIMPQERDQILSTIRDVSRRASSDARRIAHLLADGGISGRGLVESLSLMRDEIRQALPDLDLQVIVTGQLDEMPNAAARAMYRVIQTLLQNVIKHSGAHSCSINIVAHDDHYHLGVEDDGKGFDSAGIRGGMGLREMRARIELVGGNVRIESAPDRGSYIEVTIPRHERATQ